MTELEEHCRWIEKLDTKEERCCNLWITLCLQSTTYCLIRRMEEHEDFKKLTRLVAIPEKKLELWGRSFLLFYSPSDPNYAHPMDMFLATYLNALSKTSDEHDDLVWGLIDTVAHTKSRQFFNSKCVATSIWDKRHKDKPLIIPTRKREVRCRVCYSMVAENRQHTYRYTSRYVGDGSTSAPKLFSLCEDCLREGLDSINEKCTG